MITDKTKDHMLTILTSKFEEISCEFEAEHAMRCSVVPGAKEITSLKEFVFRKLASLELLTEALIEAK